MNRKYNRVLSIAGSDSGGGAGIQADLKTMSACGCYGMTAITAITVQNTMGVSGVNPIPTDIIIGQVRAVLDDIGADAIKIGMLHSSEIILALKETLTHYNISNVVLDPVMVATSGDKLLMDEAIVTLKNELIPLARIITPNIPEAEILLGKEININDNLPQLARELSMNGKVSVLLKAGHLDTQELTDIFYNNESDEILELASQKIDTLNTHGTGCTLSSAVASFLARGESMNLAVTKAKEYITKAITTGKEYHIGNGHGPVHHFNQFWE